MNVLFQIVLANIFVSLFSLIGIIFIGLSGRVIEKLTNWLISFASGSLLGAAFLHMIPNSLKNNPRAIYYVVLGILLFFSLEKFFRWRHCHERKCEIHSFGYLNLIGDSIHNFVDGMVVAGSFVTDFKLGLITTFAVVTHEIPQEIGDFGILLQAGFTKGKALLMNFLTALSAVVSGILGYFFVEEISVIKSNLIPFAAGGFIYVALVDLIPELHRRFNFAESLSQFILILLGISIFVIL